jgi:2-polyprenyl-3-methyl-5-hydroxy-6-metoxy-1,4-benzoquinol methylase
MAQAACIACDGTSFTAYSRELISCQTCGLIRATHIPNDKELTKLYQQEYFFGKEYFDYEADRPALEHNFSKRLKTLKKYLTPSTKLVEVGCAYGYFLNLVQDSVGSHQGYDVSVEGVAFAQKELGLNATTQDFLQANIAPGSVDLICMWDVIEHLAHPEKFIAKISQALAPGGHLALTTGDIAGLVPRLRGERWRMIHPPTHLYYFAPKTLARLLEQYGLSIEVVRHPSTYRNLGSVINQIKLNRRAQKKPARVFEWADQLARSTGLARLSIPLNTLDIMEVVAVKK